MTRTFLNRRDFIISGARLGTCLSFAGLMSGCATDSPKKKNKGMQFGLVTYQWGRDWDLPTLISTCEQTNYKGVELRTQHAHGVEPGLSKNQRQEVKKRFQDSPVVCVGYGSNQEYHSPDPDELERNIQGTYDLIKLCHDIGASGVKVKPNTLPEDVPNEQTIEQIGMALNKVGRYAADYGQKIRVEVHGRYTAEIPNMKAIFEHVTEPNVGICWNCNDQDLIPPGLETNFNMLKARFADTVHVRELNVGDYPYQKLFDLFVGMNYNGWILLEARTEPENRIAAMKEQLQVFHEMIANARESL